MPLLMVDRSPTCASILKRFLMRLSGTTTWNSCAKYKFQKKRQYDTNNDGGEAPFGLDLSWIIEIDTPLSPLSHDHVQKRVDGSDDPLCSFVARKPAVFLTEVLGRARLEQAENVAGQLRPNAAFGAQTGDGYHGSQRTAEVALLVRPGKR